MVFKKIFFIVVIFTVYIFVLSNCTDDAHEKPGNKTKKTEQKIEDDQDSFEIADKKSSSRKKSRRKSRRRSSSDNNDNDDGDDGGNEDNGNDGDDSGNDGDGGNDGDDNGNDGDGGNDDGDGDIESGDRCSPGTPYGNYSRFIARCPLDVDGGPDDFVSPRQMGGSCIGNLLWLRENCNRLPNWLDQAASDGFEKVEIKSNGDVVWHWGTFFGLWKRGTWKNGRFLGERWENGHWEKGLWEADNEDWITGYCYSFDEDDRREGIYTPTDRHLVTNSPAHPNSPCLISVRT